MNKREKILVLAIGLTLGVCGLGYAVKVVFQKPLTAWDKKIAATRFQINKLKDERRTYFKDEALVKQRAQRTFSEAPDQASAKSGEMVGRAILQSGLRETDFLRVPFGPRKLAQSIDTVEIGWSVQGEGKLANVVDLMFLLQESPYLHRIEGVTLNPTETPGHVKVVFKFLTLVIKPAPPVEFAELEQKFTLYSPERKTYDELVARDLLRPYIKRPPPASPGGPRPPVSPGEGVPLGPENYRVVSLSEWGGQAEVHVRDVANQKTLRFKPGEALAGGSIVLVDYRRLPTPGKEELGSDSRVIVKIGTEYWAVERGQTLAQKYRLSPGQLPEQLAKLIK